jgi:hypothetical protein
MLLLFVLGCSRSGLYPGEAGELELAGGGGSGASAATAGSTTILGGAPGTVGGSGGKPTTTGGATGSSCEAAPEICNGLDDDCDGAVDDLPAVACPGGGFQFCLTGRLSACPKRCEVCVPGSVRVCQNSFCSFWGEQECSADGLGFSNCREAHPPPECEETAKRSEDSPELEQCCIDNGYCCLDQHDLDRDGDRREMLGACGDVVCQ